MPPAELQAIHNRRSVDLCGGRHTPLVGIRLARHDDLLVTGWLAAWRIATWKVNSVLARLPRLAESLEQHALTGVCLQEAKAGAGRPPGARGRSGRMVDACLEVVALQAELARQRRLGARIELADDGDAQKLLPATLARRT
jgi:hypothetical protein